MLTIINRYCHGYIAIPVILSCKTHHFFTKLKQRPASLYTLNKELDANSGHLQVALKLMQSMAWLVKDHNNHYHLTPKAALYEKIPDTVLTILDFPMDAYLRGGNDKLSLHTWIEHSKNKWDIDDEVLPDFIDSLLIIPLWQSLDRCGFYDKKNKRITVERLSEPARTEIHEFFAHKAWCDENGTDITLTDIGKFMMDRSMNTGTVASYTPMLRKMGDLLFGDCASVFSVDELGHETHVERTLNVVSSGFQHDKYFRDVEDVVLAIFNQPPFEQQPRYVADMGCGDGTFLKRVYETVRDKSDRGKVLGQYPLTMIGIDYNEKALAATTATLGDIDHLVIQGDIGNPYQMELDLQTYVTDIDRILYIRSFLDHDRPFIAPENSAKVESRAGMPYHGVYVDQAGGLIEPKIAVQSLVEHLQRWAAIQSKYGIIILEVHSLSALTTSRFLDENENLHFDAYHAFSRQFLTEAEAFVMSAAEAGLIPQFEYSKRYSKIFPFTRVTINYFRKKPYTIRHAVMTDAAALAQLEINAFPAALQSSARDIGERIKVYPQGQSVLEVDGNIIAAIYSQRVSEIPANVDIAKKTDWRHTEDGANIDLLYVVVSNSGSNKRDNQFGCELLEFMHYYSLLTSEVDGVFGMERCRGYLALPNHINARSNTLSHCIDDFVNAYEILPEQDTIYAELALEAFGAKWLLRIFQDMGVLKEPGETYSSSAELADQLNILSKYARLFDSLLGIFERYELLSIGPQGIVATKKIAGFSLANIEQSSVMFERKFRADHPHFTPFLELMFCCLKKYGDVLVGECEANDVVFPDGSMALFAGIFKGNCVADYFNALLAETIYQKLRIELEKSPGTHINILEIGAGTGGATRFVANKINDFAENITLYYTDISSSFTRYGEKTLGKACPWMTFERLNIETDPVSQGFALNSFDIIYASNVLHDTKYLSNTFLQVKKLLKDGGLLVLNEFTVMKDLLLYTGGLLHGWWLFDDPENRLKNSCLLSVEKWDSILHKSGFSNVNAYGLPFQKSLSESRQSVLFCESAIEKVVLEKNIVAVENDKESLSLVHTVLSEILGEKRMAIFSPDLPLMEQGLDSLELLELRAQLSKQLGVKLDASFLFQYNTAVKISKYIAVQSVSITADSQVSRGRVTNTVDAPVRDLTVIQTIENTVREIIGDKRIVAFSPDIPLMELGLDSLELLELRSQLSKKIGQKLDATFLFQFNTAEKIYNYIAGQALSNTSATGVMTGRAGLAELSIKNTNQLIISVIKSMVQAIIGDRRMVDFSSDTPLMELGLDSLELLELRAQLAKKLGVKLDAPFLFQYNTADKISRFIQDNALHFSGEKAVGAIPHKNESINDKIARKPIISTSQNQHRKNDIAIIGVSLRFPGELTTTDDFWDFLKAEKSAIGTMPRDRWNWPADVDIAGEKAYLLRGGYLASVDEFDAPFFRISPKEAELMDPQQRILLELSWGVIEDAGYKPSSMQGSDTGVYIGACHFEYRKLLEASDFAKDAYLSTGSSGSIIANRISYFYNFQGPSILLDTACSSSLVAVHEAVRGIREGECQQALVGGVNIISNSVNVLSYDEAGMLSKDGTCFTFDERANGYVRGEGAGMVFLKTLEAARRDNDDIYAIIKGGAVNHGGQASSLTAPNPEAQAKLIFKALNDARIPAVTVGYIEAHGTATPLGDPIEVEGLKQAFMMGQQENSAADKGRCCGLGSVKSNLGHLEGAAGMAGLIKVLLSLKHKTIPASLNYKNINPDINLVSPFYIVEKATPWTPVTDDNGRAIPRRAGVSAFGFGGANAHIILEEFEKERLPEELAGPYVFVLSAKNELQLDAYVKRYLRYFDKTGNVSNPQLCQLSFTLQIAREALEQRLAVVFTTFEQLYDALIQFSTGKRARSDLYHGNIKRLSAESAMFIKGKTAQASQENGLQQLALHDIARLWIAGVDIQWRYLYGTLIPSRIRLPSYPFAKERYWIPKQNNEPYSNERFDVSDSAAGLTSITAIHPLLHRGAANVTAQRISSASLTTKRASTKLFTKQPFTRAAFVTVLTGQEFFLDDHRVNGQRVLPGVAYLEMARAAVLQVTGRSASDGMKLRDVVWIKPINVGRKPVQVYIELAPEDTGDFRYQIYSDAETAETSRIQHSEGLVSYSPVHERPCLDLQRIKTRCSQKILSANECYAAFSQIGIDYGPGHKAIEALYIGTGEAMAKLKLPASVFDNHEQFVLHPSLLDSALQASYAFMIASGNMTLSLPFALDECEIFHHCTPRMWAIIKQRSQLSSRQQGLFDIDVCDEKGVVCVRLKGYAPRILTEKALSLAAPVMLTPVWDWVPVAKAPIDGFSGRRSSSRLVIVGDAEDNHKSLLQYYPHARVLGGHSSDSVDVIVQRLQQLGEIDHIVWVAPCLPLDSLIDEALIDAQNDGVLRCFRLIKALLSLHYDNNDLHWTVITTQTQPIYKDDQANPAHASLHGLIGSMAKEYVNWKVRLVDLASRRHWPLHEIVALPPDPQGNAWVYRRQQWHRQQLIPVQPTLADRQLYKQNGVYVVIGGAGGIGEAWSEFMIRHYHAQIIWLGRRPKDEAIQRKLNTLGELGCPPHYIAADATDNVALQKAYDEIKHRYSNVNGVVHSALVLSDQGLVNMEEERFKAGLEAKVDVSVRIAQVFKNEPLDFVMFFSSITAFTKAPGQSNYASGCVFKDTYAHQLAREWPCAVKVMNWGYWGSVGIVASAQYHEMMAKYGIGSIEPPEAMQALQTLLCGEIDQMAFVKMTDTIQ